MDAQGKSSRLVVSFGEMLIDFVPTVSGVSLAEAPGFLSAPGGAPANVAIAVRKLGGNAAFIGKLGDDEFGHMLAGILTENDVTIKGVTFDKGARTALAFVTLRSDGEREFMFYRNPSADMLLTPEELNLDLIRSAKVFHYGSISLIVEPCRSAHLKAMEVAQEAGALLSYDPNLRLPLWPSADEAREQILSIWDKANIVKVSDDELEFLTGSDKIDDETALSLWRPNFKLLLVTLGEKGCNYYTKSFRGHVDSFRVDTVDTTGAGDSFVGAILNKFVNDESILEDEAKLRGALRFACACGAITTTKKGVIPNLPTESQALSLIGESQSSGQPKKLNPLETRAMAWDEAERAKYLARYKLEEVKIQAWENHEKREAEMAMRIIEVKAEQLKSRAQEKYTNKLAATKRIAEEKRSNAESKLNEKALKTSEKADYIKRTGHMPSSSSLKLPSFCW